MSEMQMLSIAASLVATMFGLLCVVLGWIGTRLHNKVDQIGLVITQLFDKFHEIELRVTAVETKWDIFHDQDR